MANAAAPAPEQKKGKGKLLVIAVIVVVVLAGGGFAAWKFLAAPPAASAEAQATGAASAPAAVDMANMVSVEVPTFLVNLADPLGRRYIKLTMEMEVPNATVAGEIETQMPRVRDTVNLLLSSKTYTDLASYENKILLKNEIMERVNQALGGIKVMRVNFLELVIQ